MKKKILIIDDEADFCHFVKLNLEKKEDFEVFTAATGVEGLEIARKEHPDLILLDLLMPEMDGSEVAEKLLLYESTKNIPIIFLTALAQKKEVETHYGRIGGRTFLAKPITPEELIKNINNVLKEKNKSQSEV